VSIESTAGLLARVFPDAQRISRSDYLEWLYEASPFGPVVEANLDDEQGRAGHYALVPIALTADGAPRTGALSLNTAVDERARGGGVFVRLATEAIEEARRRGVQSVLGVANANSTPGFLRRLSFELAGPLPATVLLPLPGRRERVRSTWADEAAFGPGGVAGELDALLAPPERGIARTWTPDTLRWRLASPGSRYALHRSEHVLLVTTADRRAGVPVAVLLKAFASVSPGAVERRALVRAACRLHRAPLALHVGLNDVVAFRGPPLPERLRASPLNLVVRQLDGAPSPSSIARLELLDFDAY
jgi:GNAT superfamily N-acetyltransferase